MNQNFIESRLLINIVGGVIRQDDLFPVRRKLNWDQLFHLAEYHRVSNIVYLGILGGTDGVPELWRERFFVRYQQALRYADIYEQAETQILSVLKAKSVQAFILESSAIRKFYEIPETANMSPLRLLFPEEAAYTAGKGLLVDLGYETDQYYPSFGEHMKGQNGFLVEIYYRLPFLGRRYDRNMRRLLKNTDPDRDFPNIRSFRLEGSYIFRLAEMSYRYCSDRLLIRDLLDTYRLHVSIRKKLNTRVTELWLRNFGIDGISVMLLGLGTAWFGPHRGRRAGAAAGRGAVTVGGTPVSRLLLEEAAGRILSGGSPLRDSLEQAAALREQIRLAMEIESRDRVEQSLPEKILHLFDWKERTERKTGTAAAGGTGADAGMSAYEDVETEGKVTYTVGSRGAVLRTPYFLLTLPEFWLGRCSVSCRPFREDYSESDLPLAERNSGIYTLAISYRRGAESRARVLLLKLYLFCDIENAALKISSGNEYYYTRDMAYYLGKLLHREHGGTFTMHVVAERFEYAEGSGRENRILNNMQDSIPEILTSLTPIHDTLTAAEKKNEEDNKYIPFRDWQYGDMPEEYYTGNIHSANQFQEK